MLYKQFPHAYASEIRHVDRPTEGSHNSYQQQLSTTAINNSYQQQLSTTAINNSYQQQLSTYE
jgi:hypothetical protein